MKNKVPQPLIVKKYENRRLYNTQTSQYINQEQVAQLVREGYDVRVIEAVSGEDITRLVLAQIVLDDAKTPNSVFPLDVLRQMVVTSGKATQENALRYMKAMMEVYQNAYRALPSPLNGFGFIPGGWLEQQKAGHADNTAPAAAPPVPEGAGAEVEELRRRVEELEALLAGSKPRIRSGKTKSRRKS